MSTFYVLFLSKRFLHLTDCRVFFFSVQQHCLSQGDTMVSSLLRGTGWGGQPGINITGIVS